MKYFHSMDCASSFSECRIACNLGDRELKSMHGVPDDVSCHCLLNQLVHNNHHEVSSLSYPLNLALLQDLFAENLQTKQLGQLKI